MTAPAISMSVVLPGAPSAPTGVGAGDSGLGGVFEGLLAALANAGDPKPASTGLSPDGAASADRPEDDATQATPDAGLALLLTVPAAAPLVTPAIEPEDAASTPDVLAARQTRPTETGAVPQSSTPEIPALVEDQKITRDVAQAEAAQPEKSGAAEPKAAAPAAPRTDPAVGNQAASSRPAAPAPAPVSDIQTAPPPPPAVAAVEPRPEVAPTIIAAAAGETPVAPEALRVTPTTGDIRRAAGSRSERRADATGRPASVDPTGSSPVKAAASAILAEAIDPTPSDAVAPVDAESLAKEPTDAPAVDQPSLPAEIRAQTAQALATADAAAATRGSPETVAKLAADIIRKLDGQSTRFDLELNPHGMGKVDVAIEIDRAGKLTAAMTFDTAQSAAELRGRSAELRHALEQAGFSVSDSGLTFDTAGQNAGFGGRDAAQQQQDRAWSGRAFQRAQNGADEADLIQTGAPPLSSGWTRSGVDIRI